MSELSDLKTEDFEDGENEQYTGRRMSCQKDEHTWRYVQSGQIECEKCRVGYLLSPGGELKENHVFIHGLQVI